MMLSGRFLLSIVVAALAAACGGDSPTSPSQVNVPFSTTDLRVGTGAAAGVGSSATVAYSGWLYSQTAVDNKGTRFDSGSFTFTVGSGVITGFSNAVVGMRAGGIRRTIIPPALAYGSSGRDSIPPNATLVFEIELLSVN
jgi:FKBP-type peptidyl-prolyl cis-trans isomerase FkpA